MVDIDALALDFCRANADMNNIKNNIYIYGSIGYDSVKIQDFDLIVSNIPAKVGKEMLEHIIKDAQFYLSKNGIIAIVVISQIAEYIQELLLSDTNITILYHKSYPGHEVYHYTFNKFSKNNKEKNILLEQSNLKVREQDPLLHLLNFKIMKCNSDNIVIFNSFGIEIPLYLINKFNPKQIYLINRNLQELTTLNKEILYNYTENKIHIYHQVDLSIKDLKVDIIIGLLPEQESLSLYTLFIKEALQMLSKDCHLILISSSNVISKIEELITKESFVKLKRTRNKGQSVIILKKIQ